MTSDVYIVRHNKRKFLRFPGTLTPTGSCSKGGIPFVHGLRVYFRAMFYSAERRVSHSPYVDYAPSPLSGTSKAL